MPNAIEIDDDDVANPVAQLRAWLAARHGSPLDVECRLGGNAAVRGRLPSGRYNRMLITELLICALKMALDGNEAAEMLVACFPSVMMRKGCSFKVALATLMGQCAPPEPTATKIATNETRFARALQNACADRQTFGIYRVLDRHNTPVADNDAETVRAVAAQLFTRNLEHETPDEEIAYAAHRGLREECQHDAAVPIRAAMMCVRGRSRSRDALQTSTDGVDV